MRVVPVLLACTVLTGCVLNRRGTRPSDAGALDAGGPLVDAGPAPDARSPGVDAGPPTVDGGGCPSGRLYCPGAGCVEASTDPDHCGGCDERCSAPLNGMATCSGGACGFACEPGFDRDGAGCRPSRCGNGMLDMGEACDDGNGVAGDGCSESCAMESTATGTCPGAEIWLSGTRQHYTGDTRGQASTIRCSSTAAGPDAIFTIHTAWSGNLRIHLHPRGPWDATLNTRPSCPITGESYLCVDSGGGGADEQIFGGVFADGVYSVVVSGYRGGDAGSFEIWFEAG